MRAGGTSSAGMGMPETSDGRTEEAIMRILDPALRHHDLGRAPRVSAPADRAWLYRAAFWAMLGADLFAGWGIRWDLQWHRIIGRDSFWIAPHIMIYTGVVLTVAVSFGVLAFEWSRGSRGTPGFHLAALGIAITVVAAPIDNLWHRFIGPDVWLWSPPHLLGIVGGAVHSAGCVLIAYEVYPAVSAARRFVAAIAASAQFYAGL